MPIFAIDLSPSLSLCRRTADDRDLLGLDSILRDIHVTAEIEENASAAPGVSLCSMWLIGQPTPMHLELVQ